MRVAYLLAGLGQTGGSMVLYGFMDGLCVRGHEVFAITPVSRIRWEAGLGATIVGAFQRGDASGGVPARLTEAPPPGVTLKARVRRHLLKRTLGRPAQQLVLITEGLLRNWVPSDVTIATSAVHTAYVAFDLMNRTVPLYHMQHYEEIFFDDPRVRRIARLTYFLPLRLIANSTWLQGQIAARTGRRADLLLPGLDREVFSPQVDVNAKYRAPRPISIVSYYSPVRFKAWDDAVEAMRIVLGAAPPGTVEWVVYGGRPSREPDLPIRYAGRVFGPALARLYAESHVCFMNSWYESFPLPPLEAMACGTAVVTTRLGTEDYAVDEENALVVPPRSPAALAAAIRRLIEDPALARRLALAGAESARRFGWDRAVDTLEGILQAARRDPAGRPFEDLDDLVAGRLRPEQPLDRAT